MLKLMRVNGQFRGGLTMTYYKVEWKEVVTYLGLVEADSLEEAEEKAKSFDFERNKEIGADEFEILNIEQQIEEG